MDKQNHYNNNNNIINNNNITTYTNTNDINNTTNDKKSFSQRLGEANIMPDGMLSTIDDTDRVILAIEHGVHESQLEQENDR